MSTEYLLEIGMNDDQEYFVRSRAKVRFYFTGDSVAKVLAKAAKALTKYQEYVAEYPSRARH